MRPHLVYSRTPLLVYSEEDSVYRVPSLNGSAYPTSETEYHFESGGAVLNVVGGVGELESVLAWMVALGAPPHRVLRRTLNGYRYVPWGIEIEVDEVHPMGSTFMAEIQGVTVKIHRLRTFRALLGLLGAP